MNTREERLAENIARYRRDNPTLPETFWEDMAEKQRLQWQVDDLREGVARLSGKWGLRDPGNVELIADLDALLT